MGSLYVVPFLMFAIAVFEQSYSNASCVRLLRDFRITSISSGFSGIAFVLQGQVVKAAEPLYASELELLEGETVREVLPHLLAARCR